MTGVVFSENLHFFMFHVFKILLNKVFVISLELINVLVVGWHIVFSFPLLYDFEGLKCQLLIKTVFCIELSHLL
jgi:hypothetical protein